MWVVYHWLKDIVTGETIVRPFDTVLGEIGDNVRIGWNIYEITDVSSEYEDFVFWEDFC